MSKTRIKSDREYQKSPCRHPRLNPEPPSGGRSARIGRWTYSQIPTSGDQDAYPAPAAAVAPAAALPDAPADESAFDWLERVELEAMARYPLKRQTRRDGRGGAADCEEALRPKAKTPDVTIDGKEAEALLAVLSRTADFCEEHGADRDLVKRLKAAIDKLTADRDMAVGRAASLRNHLSDFGKGGRGRK
jgi:hypothetical protein